MNTTVEENGSSGSSDIYATTFVTAGLAVNFILSLPLNVYVLWLMLAGTRQTLASDFFSLNLTVSEIFFLLSCPWYFLYLKWKIWSCLKVFLFATGLLYTARPLLQCCICVEYYVGVVHPVLFLRFKPLRYRILFFSFVWLVIFISCVYTTFTSSNNLYLYLYFIQSLTGLCIVLFCCLSVLRALKRPEPGRSESERTNSNAKKRKAFNIILLTMVSMAFTFVTFMVPIPLQCCLDNQVFHFLINIGTIVTILTGLMQPLHYLNRSGKLPCYRKT